MNKITLGFALCGSFCTFKSTIEIMKRLSENNFDIVPIMSFNASEISTRFGKCEDFINEIENISGKRVIKSILDAEPIGPKKILDALLIEPCTGNTLGKLANGIADTPVTLAAKAHLRNEKPLIIAVSSNDALATSAGNIGSLLNRKNVFFVPMRQDDPGGKPRSIVADFVKTEETIRLALKNEQIQPIILT